LREHPTIDEFANVKRIADAVSNRPKTRAIYRI
jgi:hypothetical protein